MSRMRMPKGAQSLIAFSSALSLSQQRQGMTSALLTLFPLGIFCFGSVARLTLMQRGAYPSGARTRSSLRRCIGCTATGLLWHHQA
jgi:hypothetical protein